MDRLVMLELRRFVSDRELLAAALRDTDHGDPDFPALLAAVRDAKAFSVPELAELVGLSRSHAYGLLAEYDAERHGR